MWLRLCRAPGLVVSALLAGTLGCELLAGIEARSLATTASAGQGGSAGAGGGAAGGGALGGGGAGGSMGGQGGEGGCSPGSDPGCPYWAVALGDVAPEQARELAVDADGNVFVLGLFSGTFLCGGSVLQSDEGDDLFLAKLSPQGSVLWCKSFPSDVDQNSYGGLAVDGQGNAVLAGHSFGATNFGAQPLCGEKTASGADVLVAKFDSNGACLWARVEGGAGDQIARDVAVTSGGDVVVVGYYAGSFDYAGVPILPASLSGSADGFVMRLAGADGAVEEVVPFGSGGDDFCAAVALDGADRIHVTGNTTGQVSFGGSCSTAPPAGGRDIFVAKYDASLECQWAQLFGGSERQDGIDIAVDPLTGELFFSGFTYGSFLLGPSWLSATNRSGFVGKLDQHGAPLVGTAVGCSENAPSVAVDAHGDVTVGFLMVELCDFGSGETYLFHGGTIDSALVKLSGALEFQWSHHFGSAGDEYITSVAADGSEGVLVTGRFGASVDFGGIELQSAGAADAFVAKFTP